MDDRPDLGPNWFALGAALLVGLIWLALATTCLVSAFQGAANGRADWWLAWFLVGTLLAAAGFAALGATVWHQFRVKRRVHEQ
jgi:hypothetical protein